MEHPMDIENFVSRLEGVQRTSRGYRARCPAHQDRTPSLSICETQSRILLHCFAGCVSTDIVSAMGLEMRGLFMDTPIAYGQRPPKPKKLDLVSLAFQFELAALDHRLRAERVLNATQNFHLHELTDHQLDRILSAVSNAYLDRGRAEFLETVADDMRVRAYREKTERHAA